MNDKKNKNDSRSASGLKLSASAQSLLLELPRPTQGRGTSVPKALRLRRTIREISDRKLSPQVLSNLLWSACGVNRYDRSVRHPWTDGCIGKQFTGN